MSEFNWKSKLVSRKFWAAIIGFVSALMTAFAVPSATLSQVTAIIMAFATLIAYIIGEGLVDAACTGSTITENKPVTEVSARAASEIICRSAAHDQE